MERLNKTFIYLLMTMILVLSVTILQTFKYSSFSSINNITMQNIDASYHVLLTDTAYERTPIKTHLFLPLISLGNEIDKGIPWGEAIHDRKRSNYYYSSFSSLGFLAPYLFFKIINVQPDLIHLIYFNIGIATLCTFLMIILCAEIHRTFFPKTELKLIPLFLAAATYLFSLESLYSHGIIYWHQSLYQPILITQLFLLLRLLRHELSLGGSIAFIVLSVLGPLVEWTGYITNLGLSLSILIYLGINKKSSCYVGMLILATIFSGCIFILHFLLVIDPYYFFYSLKNRFLARTITSGEYLSQISLLFRGYLQSYSLLIIVAIIAFCMLLMNNIKEHRKLFWIFLFASFFPVLENIIMLQHAGEYHFDRLKVVIPLIILIFSASLIKKNKILFLTFWLIGIIFNIILFLHSLRNEQDLQVYVANDNRLFAEVNAITPSDCPTVYAIPFEVRGWISFTLNRGVYEHVKNPDALRKYMLKRKACAGVLFEGRIIKPSILSAQKATVINKDQVTVITLTEKDHPLKP